MIAERIYERGRKSPRISNDKLEDKLAYNSLEMVSNKKVYVLNEKDEVV